MRFDCSVEDCFLEGLCCSVCLLFSEDDCHHKSRQVYAVNVNWSQEKKSNKPSLHHKPTNKLEANHQLLSRLEFVDHEGFIQRWKTSFT